MVDVCLVSPTQGVGGGVHRTNQSIAVYWFGTMTLLVMRLSSAAISSLALARIKSSVGPSGLFSLWGMPLAVEAAFWASTARGERRSWRVPSRRHKTGDRLLLALRESLQVISCPAAVLP